MDRETWPVFRLKVTGENTHGYVVYDGNAFSNTTFHKFQINMRRHDPGTISWLQY